MNLYDMINCSILSVSHSFAGLQHLRTIVALQIGIDPSKIVDEGEIKKIRQLLLLTNEAAVEFEMNAVKNRIARFRSAIENPINHNDLKIQIVALYDALEDGLKNQLIYRYPDAKAAVLWNWKEDWSEVILAFPKVESDIKASVDLWALGHATASVFQFMRILEIGLLRLSNHLDIDYTIQNWQNIIDQIEAKIRKQQKSLPRGQEKNEELQFLSESAKEFSYFKDGWRNYVSHNKVSYDDDSAHRVMEHVKQFMTTLSYRLSSFQLEERD